MPGSLSNGDKLLTPFVVARAALEATVSPNEQFASRLRRLRRSAGLSQEELGHRVGVATPSSAASPTPTPYRRHARATVASPTSSSPVNRWVDQCVTPSRFGGGSKVRGDDSRVPDGLRPVGASARPPMRLLPSARKLPLPVEVNQSACCHLPEDLLQFGWPPSAEVPRHLCVTPADIHTTSSVVRQLWSSASSGAISH